DLARGAGRVSRHPLFPRRPDIMEMKKMRANTILDIKDRMTQAVPPDAAGIIRRKTAAFAGGRFHVSSVFCRGRRSAAGPKRLPRPFYPPAPDGCAAPACYRLSGLAPHKTTSVPHPLLVDPLRLCVTGRARCGEDDLGSPHGPI